MSRLDSLKQYSQTHEERYAESGQVDPMSPVNKMLFEAAKAIENNNYVKVDEICEKLGISRETLNYKLRELRYTLDLHGLLGGTEQ